MTTHCFEMDVAVQYGVNAAILLHNIYFWCEHNRTNEKHFHDGRYWTYNSRKAFLEQFPYMGEKQLRNALKTLKDEGLVVVGNYNQLQFDRTAWYALTEKGIDAVTKGLDAFGEKANANGKKGQPIPDIYPDTIYEEDKEDELPRFDTVQAYAGSVLKYLGARAMEELNSFADDLSEDIVRHAIDNALDAGVRTWNYVRKILNGYVEDGVKTLDEAIAHDKKHRGIQKQEKPQTAAPEVQEPQDTADPDEVAKAIQERHKAYMRKVSGNV